METILNNERRTSLRDTVSLATVVKGKESADEFWKETTIISTVSRTGASFNLKRICPIGGLISLIMPLPSNLRCYDADSELYRVWGLVQHCNAITSEEFSGYHIGIAFIGKYAPASYKSNPLNSYRISGINENGLWNIFEAPRAFVARKSPRFGIPLEVNLAVLDPEGNISAEETATTENISLHGAAVVSSLDVKNGDQIKFTYPKHDFSSIAIVRSQQKMAESMSILHLEFDENEFPMKETVLPAENFEII